MQFLTLLIILAVTLATFLTDIHLAPSQLKFLPEALSVPVIAYIAFAGPRERFHLIASRYWMVFGAAGVIVVCGVLVNVVAPGTLISGMRFYLRAIPMFFLPAIYRFTEKQLRTQLNLLLVISLLQLPISIYQRYVILSHGRQTGDPVFGTLMISSIMSVFLIAAICIAAALTLRGRLRKTTFFVLFVLLVIPTTINETKGTVLLLPIGLVATLMAGAQPRRRLRIAVSAIALVALFGALYIPVYNYFATLNNPYPYTIEGFFSNKKTVSNYLDPGTDLGSRKGAGRIDSLTVPLETFAHDPVRLMFGVGIGNGSPSSLGKSYTGEYNELLGRYTASSSASAFLVEVGVLGLVLAMLLDWFVLRDALYVARHDETLVGTIALGWIGVTLVMVLGTFYKNVHAFESLSYLFWYFSGLIAAQRMQLQFADQAVRTRPLPRLALVRRQRLQP